MRAVAITMHKRTQAVDGLIAGLVVSLTSLPFALSLAVLVFSGPLARHMGVGIGIVLFSGLVLGLTLALLSGDRRVIARVQDQTTVILAGAAATTAAEVEARSPGLDPLATVLVLLACGSLLTGATMWTLGRLRLGRLVRYIPHPVIAGFLGGTGCVLVLGAVKIMVGGPLLAALAGPDALLRWLPGLGFGCGLTWWMRRRPGKLAVPQALALAAGLFFAAIYAVGVSPAAALADGWLLGPLPGGALWPPPVPSPGEVDWLALLHALPNLGPLVLVAVLGLLLNISGAEARANAEFDLDRELQATGAANLAVAGSAGLPGYMSLGSFNLLDAMETGDRTPASRVPAIVAALASGVFLIIGAAPLAWIPRGLLGGLLVFLGADLVLYALRDSRAQLPAREFVLVLAIVGVIVAWGFLAGVAVGLLISVALFALDNSRVDIIKETATGAELRSNIARGTRHQQLLDAHGGQIRALQLQGYIFFGSAHRLLGEVTGELEAGAQLRFLVADFRQVIGVDCSAAATLARLQRKLQAHEVALVCTGLAPAIDRLLTLAGCDLHGATARVVPDLDHALEWCEEQVLAAAGARADDVRLADEFAALARDPTLLPRLLVYAARVELPAGAPVFAAGDVADGLYLIEEGLVTAWLEPGDRPGGAARRRLRTMGPGTMIGESALYLHARRSAAVVCDTAVCLRWLPGAALAQMKRDAPELLAELHRVCASLLADRLVRTTAALQRRFHVS